MEQFHFKGEWSFDLKLSGFSGFQESDGRLSVDLSDLLNEDPDPLPEQVAAVNYILQNHNSIARNICEKVYEEYPELIKIYDELPEISSADDIKKHIRISQIRVNTRFKNGISFTDFYGNCVWDQEHGLCFGVHGSKVFFMGGAGDGYGTDDDAVSQAMHVHEKRKPKIYLPHPKYGKLKPSQVFSNRYYELELIRGFYNEDFKELIISGKRDVNYVDLEWGFFGNFIAWAIQYNNHELVDFLMARNARLNHILHEVGRDRRKIEWLLDHGVSINERSRSGHVLLRGELFNLRTTLMNRDMMQLRNPGYQDEYYTKTIAETMEHIQWLVGKGADPALADLRSVLSFSGRDYDNEKIRRIILESISPTDLGIKSASVGKAKDATVRRWWKFWG